VPSKNRVKIYVKGDYYHLYNRGVEKRVIFQDEYDYRVFLGYLKRYFSPTEPFARPHKDLTSQVELAAYCLMPNHFHLLVRQLEERGIEVLMRCLATAYVRYFNHRHNRVGALFQDAYKAVRIGSNEQLYQVDKYIHQNPRNLIEQVNEYPYSSAIRLHQPPAWLKPVATTGHSYFRTVLDEDRPADWPVVSPYGLI
jgi:putative transposase